MRCAAPSTIASRGSSKLESRPSSTHLSPPVLADRAALPTARPADLGKRGVCGL